MAKLWDKGYTLDKLIEEFTIGDDPHLDKALVSYDCVGSIAHAYMLKTINVLSHTEFLELKDALKEISEAADNGDFVIRYEDEDVHTAVENSLVNKLGSVGKKIHTGRSRNDQVLLDLRMYMRDELLAIAQETLLLSQSMITLAEKHVKTPMVGRTHFQRAMPSSVGLIFGSFAEGLLDDFLLIKGAYDMINQCPLGSAASYGVTLPLDRHLVSHILGFDRLQNNVLYVNNSRGKFESVVLSALSQIMITLSKMSTDLILFSTPEFGYFALPEELCSGSSLMPQKRNPCGLELVRAKSATVIGNLMQILTLVRALPSGYNRDFQETKKPLMESLRITKQSLKVLTHTIKYLHVDENACLQSMSAEIFATDAALRLINEGLPFREAYKTVAMNPGIVHQEDPVANIMSKTHAGAPGNLGLELSLERINDKQQWINTARQIYTSAIKKLIDGDNDD